MQKVKSGKLIDTYKLTFSTRECLLTHDKEVSNVSVVAYLNNGQTVSHSKTFKSLRGAEKYAASWVSQ